MKKNLFILLLIILPLVIFNSFRSAPFATISGKVTPADAAISVSAISDTDSVSTQPSAGAFALTAKAGTWRIFVRAKPPYKDAVLDKIQVAENGNTDVGEITLQQ